MRLWVVFAALAMLIAACGGETTDTTADVADSATTEAEESSTDDTEAEADDETDTETTEAGAAEGPKHGGVLTMAIESDPISFDPHTNANFSSLLAYDHVYESLTAYDEDTNVIPSLAESWEVSDDGTVYTFNLRDGVKFHNGDPLTASDVKYSLDRVLDPDTAAPFVSWLGPVTEVRAVDDSTVEIELESPFPGLLSGLAGNRASGIMPEGFAENSDVNLEAVGTGPFRLVDYVPDDSVTFERFDEYWDGELPYLDGIEGKILIEESTRVSALTGGQVDYAIVGSQAASTLEGNPDVEVLSSPTAWNGLAVLNVGETPLDDARVRKALRLAIDTDEVIQKAAFGQGVPAGPIHSGYGDWPLPEDEIPYQEPDLDQARELLAEAGISPDNPVTIGILTTAAEPEYPTFAQIMQESWRDLGVEVEIETVEFNTWVDRYLAGEYEVFATAHSFRPDPHAALQPYWHPDGNQNHGGYDNPRVTELIDQGGVTTDQEERVEIYREAQEILLEESAYLWFYTALQHEGISSELEGYSPSFTGRQLFFKKAWLDE